MRIWRRKSANQKCSTLQIMQLNRRQRREQRISGNGRGFFPWSFAAHRIVSRWRPPHGEEDPGPASACPCFLLWLLNGYVRGWNREEPLSRFDCAQKLTKETKRSRHSMRNPGAPLRSLNGSRLGGLQRSGIRGAKSSFSSLPYVEGNPQTDPISHRAGLYHTHKRMCRAGSGTHEVGFSASPLSGSASFSFVFHHGPLL